MLKIALFRFSFLLDSCFLPFYTTIAFKSYIAPTFSYRMFFAAWAIPNFKPVEGVLIAVVVVLRVVVAIAVSVTATLDSVET